MFMTFLHSYKLLEIERLAFTPPFAKGGNSKGQG